VLSIPGMDGYFQYDLIFQQVGYQGQASGGHVVGWKMLAMPGSLEETPTAPPAAQTCPGHNTDLQPP